MISKGCSEIGHPFFSTHPKLFNKILRIIS
jgi:hypothetical protein